MIGVNCGTKLGTSDHDWKPFYAENATADEKDLITRKLSNMYRLLL
jgi:hypothetical protein